MLREMAIVAIGGSVGAVLRFVVAGAMQRTYAPGGFPTGTYVVNAIGCFLIGLLMAFFVPKQPQSRDLQLLLVTGFLGGLTTFSAFSYETFELMRQDRMGLALSNVVLSVVSGVLAVWAGRTVGVWCGA